MSFLWASLRVFALFAIFLAGTATSANSASRCDQAEVEYYKYSSNDRLEIQIDLVVTGYFNSFASDKFGRRFCNSVLEFEKNNNLVGDAILSIEEKNKLHTRANAIFSYWGIQKVTHPSGIGYTFIPLNITPKINQTKRGMSFEADDRLASIDFSLIPNYEYTFIDLYRKLATPDKKREVKYKIITDEAFVVNGISSGRNFHIRYLNLGDQSFGFTVSWKNEFKNGQALAIFMANTLFLEPNSTNPSQAPQESAPVAVSPPIVAPPVSEAETLPSENTVYSGSGFFVSANGDGITNQHVVEGCSEVTIAGKGKANVTAIDQANDLALIKLLDGVPTEAVRFRTQTAQLGEQAFVLGFPLAGTLDNGLNFTTGTVSSLAGIGGNSTMVQFTAPIQPGNSGGPIVDTQGRLVGITVAKLKDIETLKSSGQLPQNVNFGIKSEIAIGFLALNGLNVQSEENGAPLQTTEIATKGRGFTFQVFCRPNN